ncbi:hypothetical protein F4774DRAFT_429531 [Daldinia eschscholtzii]|nr:hypothetical protein F4774DRAFT_429531 [Daldinia eschscholtzii]
MVGPSGRLQKPKLPTALGSPHEDDTTSTETPIAPRRFNPPVLRNFSYPLNVGIQSQPPLFPSPLRTEQTAWDQLGELYNFSPNSISRTRETKPSGFEDPFSFRSETESYSQLNDKDGNEDGEFDKSAEKSGLKDKASKLTKGQSLGDRIFPQATAITSRLKRNSSGRHKATASLDTSRLMVLSSNDIDRPASSSGVLLIDTTVKTPSITTRYAPSPLIVSQEIALMRLEEGVPESQVTRAMESLEVGHNCRKKPSNENSRMGHNIIENSVNRKTSNYSTELVEHKNKGGKRRWMSQLKSWVTASEPSAQALKQYKKETYNKAHISLDDPQANAKLHLPIGTLPPNAIKPAGPGPDPEEIFLKQTEQRKKMRHSGTGSYETQGSKSSSSRYSTSSSVVFGTAK